MGDVNIDVDFPKSVFVDGGKNLIDDNIVASDKTWSSQKISEFISDESPLTNSDNNNDYLSFERTLLAGETEIIINDERIDVDSPMKLYVNKPHIIIKSCKVTNGAIRLVIEEVDKDVTIKILFAVWHQVSEKNIPQEGQLVSGLARGTDVIASGYNLQYTNAENSTVGMYSVLTEYTNVTAYQYRG